MKTSVFFAQRYGAILHDFSRRTNREKLHQFLLFWTTGKNFGLGTVVQLKRTLLRYGPPIFRQRFLYRNSEISFYTTGRPPKRGLFPIC